jgi:hypothetical protein
MVSSAANHFRQEVIMETMIDSICIIPQAGMTHSAILPISRRWSILMPWIRQWKETYLPPKMEASARVPQSNAPARPKPSVRSSTTPSARISDEMQQVRATFIPSWSASNLTTVPVNSRPSRIMLPCASLTLLKLPAGQPHWRSRRRDRNCRERFRVPLL